MCRAHLSELDARTRPTAQTGAKHPQVPRGPVVRESQLKYQSQDMHKGVAGTNLPPYRSLSLVKLYNRA